MKKTKKTAMKLIAIILSMVMLMSVIPMQGFAADVPTLQESTFGTDQETEDSDTSEEEPVEETEAVILAEDTAKREESVKHFRMSDGTMQAVQYAVPVHFEQDGQWVDYDNSLTEVDADAEENEGRSILKNKDLTNQTADYTVRLSKKTNGKKFVRLEKDGYQISWYYQNANKKTAQMEKTEDDDDPTTLEKLSTTVLYEDVFKATDLEYIVSSEGLKENLLLQSAKAPTVFTAEYKANGLTPVAVDDKTVELRAADGTVVYVLSAPYMEDVNGETSEGVTLSITSVKNNSFTLQMTLDADWLAAEEREFPVLVDPAIQTEQSVSNAQTAFVSAANPNKCYLASGSNDMGSLYVGNIDGFGRTETYIKFTKLPDIGVASKVVDARLGLGLRKCEVGLQVNVKRLVNDWDENTVTWNNGPYGEEYIADYLTLTEQTDVTTHRIVEITDMVRGWYSGDYPNYGLSLTTDKTATAKAWFYSIHYTTYYQNRPLMVISYRNMSGYEDYWSYTNITAGRGGVASVNNFNGNLVYSQPITQDDGGNLMPVSLSLVFNANQEKRSSGEQKPYVMHSLVGAFMQTNYHIYIRYDSKLAANGYKYYMNDADGTKHWFYKTDNASKFKDEDGLGLTLQEIPLGSDSTAAEAQYCVTDKDENKMYFDYWGNLIQIRNATGVSANVAYEEVSGVRRMKTITDGAGRMYTFLYGWSGQPEMVTGVKDPAGRITEIIYNGDFTVNSVKFADGKSVQLAHGNSYMLTEIKGIDGTRTKISYDSSAQKRVSQINWGASDSNLLEKYSFTYKQNSTKITDIQNRSYTYQFNDFGQTTGVVSDTDGSAQFFKLNEGSSTSSTANKLIQESRVLQTVTNYAVNPGFTRGYSDGYVNYIENTANQSVSIDTSRKNLTNSALKIYKAASNTGRVNAVQYVNGLAAGTYTFSAYVNTEGATLTGEAWVLAEVWTTGGGYVSSNWAEHTTKTDGWERKSVTFTVPEGCQVRLVLGFSANASGTVWYDDLQIEKGEGMSTYNLVENSGYTNGMTCWGGEGGAAGTRASSSLAGFDYCAKIPGTVEERYKNLLEMIPVSGKKGDVFSFGMWAYAASAPIGNGTKDGDSYQPRFEIVLHYYNTSGAWAGYFHFDCNPDLKNQWQFLSGEAIIPIDYGKISISLIYDHNVNNAYMTGAFCYKEQYGQTYDYDKDGNVTSVVDIANTNSTFSYYGNQMAKMLNPSGSKYLYNYNDKKQLYKALSSDGQEYGFSYDDKGNVTKAEIVARKPATTIESGKEYILVNSYSGLAMDSNWRGNSGDITTTYHYSPSSQQQHWKLELVSGTSDVYMLRSVKHTNSNLYLDVKGGGNGDGTLLEIYPKNTSDAQKFKVVKQSDGTFGIFTACSNYTKCLNGQAHGNDILQSQSVKQVSCTADKLTEGQKWYFYPVEKSEDKTIVTETAYTDSKNFVSSSTDQRGNQTTYSYNEQKGTLTSTTDALGRTTNYTYDANNNSLLSVSSGGMTNSYAYENDRLKTINVNNALQYQFSYDVFGRTTSTKVGNGTDWRTLSSLEYNSAGLLSNQTYGNGDTISFTYDNLDRMTQKVYNGDNSKRAAYLYGNDGSLAQTVDYSVGTRTQFTYDLANRLVSQKEYATTAKNGGTLRSSTDFTYADKTNYLTGVKHYSPLGTQTIGYTYGDINQGQMPDQIYKVSWNGQEKVNYTYDPLGRLTQKSVILSDNAGTVGGDALIASLTTEYSYVDSGENKTTTLVQSVQTAAGTYSYTYDAVGNITSVSDGTYTTSYEYDDLNQLVRVNDQRANLTYTYTYENGNIRLLQEYTYTTGSLAGMSYSGTEFLYGDGTWSDLLTGFDYTEGVNGGAETSSVSAYSARNGSNAPQRTFDDSIMGRAMQRKSAQSNGISTYSTQDSADLSIVYDDIGNPIDMFGLQFSWQGRQLTNIVVPDDPYYSNIAYQYNIDGQRVSKALTATDGTAVTTEYFYNGEILAGQKTGEDILVFMYDNNGDYFGFTVNGTPYYYVKNAQNDVTAVTDADGNIVGNYYYDEWGACTTGHTFGISPDVYQIVNANPIRYRSYYCDIETGFYFLNTRYYVPMLFRFLNADDTDVLDEDQDSLVENNLFAYCLNNPVNFSDPDGDIAVSSIVGAVVGGATGAVLGLLLANKLGLTGWKKGALIAAATIGGAALGAFLGPYVAKLAKMAGGAVKKAALNLGRKAAAKQTIKISSNKLWKSSARHIFSKKHIRGGIMQLGKSQKSIYNSIFKIVKSKLGVAANGANEIRTAINGIDTTIRFYVSNGQVMSIDAFIGFASEVKGNLLR